MKLLFLGISLGLVAGAGATAWWCHMQLSACKEAIVAVESQNTQQQAQLDELRVLNKQHQQQTSTLQLTLEEQFSALEDRLDSVMLADAEGADDAEVADSSATPKEKAQRRLLAKGIQPHAYNTAILEAARTNQVDILRNLLAAGADVNATDADKHTPLYNAVDNGHAKCVKVLLASPNIDLGQRKGSWCYLHLAAINGNSECMRILLTCPELLVNHRNRGGATALMCAASNNQAECVKLLLAVPNVDINAVCKDGYTALMYAATGGHDNCVRLLLSKDNIEVDTIANNGWTPLYAAAKRGHAKALELLLAAGANVNHASTKSEKGETPLIAVSSDASKIACAKLLLKQPGIDVNAADKQGGYFALYWAASGGNTELVRLLLRVPEIDINKRHTSYRETALDAAKSRGHSEIVSMLQNAGAKSAKELSNN